VVGMLVELAAAEGAEAFPFFAPGSVPVPFACCA